MSKIGFLAVCGLGDSGNFNFFDFGSISKFYFFFYFLGGQKINHQKWLIFLEMWVFEVFEHFENLQKTAFFDGFGLGTSLELNLMQFRIEPTNRHSISRDFEFLENSSKKKELYLVGGVG